MGDIPRRNLKVTLHQCKYLEELLADDLAQTELTPAERQQNEALQARVQDVLVEYAVRGYS